MIMVRQQHDDRPRDGRFETVEMDSSAAELTRNKSAAVSTTRNAAQITGRLDKQ